MRITINKAAIMARVQAGKENMITSVAEQALADSNEYCRVAQGTLKQSSETASDIKAGKLVWDTVYARKVYYTGEPSPDPNKIAALMWAHKAKDIHFGDWNKNAQKSFTRGFDGERL